MYKRCITVKCIKVTVLILVTNNWKAISYKYWKLILVKITINQYLKLVTNHVLFINTFLFLKIHFVLCENQIKKQFLLRKFSFGLTFFSCQGSMRCSTSLSMIRKSKILMLNEEVFAKERLQQEHVFFFFFFILLFRNSNSSTTSFTIMNLYLFSCNNSSSLVHF